MEGLYCFALGHENFTGGGEQLPGAFVGQWFLAGIDNLFHGYLLLLKHSLCLDARGSALS
jgi:hypothetical protein